MNGDGIADIVISAYDAAFLNRTNNGATYVMERKADIDPKLI